MKLEDAVSRISYSLELKELSWRSDKVEFCKFC